MSAERLVLTTGRLKDGRMLAICSDGSPQLGDAKTTVLSLETVESQEEAEAWFLDVKKNRPWETRQ